MFLWFLNVGAVVHVRRTQVMSHEKKIEIERRGSDRKKCGSLTFVFVCAHACEGASATSVHTCMQGYEWRGSRRTPSPTTHRIFHHTPDFPPQSPPEREYFISGCCLCSSTLHSACALAGDTYKSGFSLRWRVFLYWKPGGQAIPPPTS